MIRFVSAFIWFRLRVLMNTIRGGKSRDRMERFARVGGLFVNIFFVILFAVPALILSFLALLGGWMAGTGGGSPDAVLLAMRGVMLAVLLVLIIVPMGRATHGSAAAEPRFLLLPVSRGTLHLVEVVAGLGDPWVTLFIPPLLLFPVGLAAAGRTTSALVALLAGIAYIGVMAAVGSTITFLMAWLLKDRRRAEIATIIFVMVMSSMGLFWLVMGDTIEFSIGDEEAGGMTIAEFNEKLPAWTLAIPSELYGRGVGGFLRGAGLEGTMGLVLLLLEASLLFAASAYAHGKAMTASSSTRGRGKVWTGPSRTLSIPGLSPGAALVARTQIRVALRTVRGKLAVYPTGLMVLVSGWVLSNLFSREVPLVGMLRFEGHLFLWFLALMVYLALQPVMMNQFATDGAGLTMQFLTPLTDREIVLGKAAGGGAIAGISLGLVVVALLILAPAGSPWSWGAALAGVASVYVLLSPIAAVISATFPKTADLSKMGKAGNPNGIAAFIGFLATIILIVPPSSLAMLGLLFRSPFLSFLLMLGWLAVSGLMAWPLFILASNQLGDRRENLALVAQGR